MHLVVFTCPLCERDLICDYRIVNADGSLHFGETGVPLWHVSHSPATVPENSQTVVDMAYCPTHRIVIKAFD